MAEAKTPAQDQEDYIAIKVPQLGESLSTAVVGEWLAREGEDIATDSVLLQLETDKVALEIYTPCAGRLFRQEQKTGAEVSPGDTLAIVVASAGSLTSSDVSEDASEDGASSTAFPAPAPQPPAAMDTEPPAAVDIKPPAAVDKENALSSLGGTPSLEKRTLDPEHAPRSEDKRVTLHDLYNFLAKGTALSHENSGPQARHSLAQTQAAPAALIPSGPGNRLTASDIERAELAASAPTAPSAAATGGSSGESSGGLSARREPMSRMRATIARRLKQAQNTAAMLTTFNEIDLKRLQELRASHGEAFRTRHEIKLGFMGFFSCAALSALKTWPVVAATIAEKEIVHPATLDLGIAVSTPSGLLVPIIRDCGEKTVADIEKALAAVAERARKASLTPKELRGGCFTITNGGVFGSLLSTPILNPPQSAILGLHKIEQRPVVRDGTICARPMMYVALTYDHRLIDGSTAVSFLVHIKNVIEEPERLLLDL